MNVNEMKFETIDLTATRIYYTITYRVIFSTDMHIINRLL